MKVYHGSNSELKMPDLLDFGPNEDLGKGFYVTADIDDAREWALKSKKDGKESVVSIYEFDESKCEEFKTARFDSFTEEWFDLILNCKNGKDESDYDIVIGAIMDKNVLGTALMFEEKLFSKKEAIKRLRFGKPHILIAFRTMNAMRGCLHFVDSETL